MKSLPSIRLIVFDIEGTTIDNKIEGIPIDIKCLYEVILERNPEISLHDLKNSKIEDHQKRFKNFNSELLKEYWKLFNKYSEKLNEADGAWEIFQWLRIHDIKIALVSTIPALIVKKILEIIGWKMNEAFDYWTCSELVDEWRPSPILIKRSMRHSHIRNISEVIKVSSSPSGIKEGKDAGVFTIALKSDWFSDEELMECNPDAFFKDFKEMLGWLKLENLV